MGMLDPSRFGGRARLRSGHAFVLGILLAGCRFGGPGTDPFAELPAAADAAHSGGASSEIIAAGGTTGLGAGGADAIGAGGDSVGGGAGSASPASGGTGGTAIARPADGGIVGSGSAPGSCQPLKPATICDPVHNIGCLVPFSFCDVDPTQAIPAGRCVFPFASAPLGPDAGAACQVNATTETCLPMSTCVNGSCRKLCYCDADCSAGACCREPAPGPSGVFRLCGPC